MTGTAAEEAIPKEEIASVSVPRKAHSVFAAAFPVATVPPKRNPRFVLQTQPTLQSQMAQLERVEGTLQRPYIPAQV